eukprot:CAMPEP_0194394904 /NCGR_PEP_ID=MMETSP0174-20130528/124115_1 /TAXON_ID=216777 /ORGANISM="Proboscia alata, Strain PI-D3" /LENGTH=421 /DNA_ID=CAMNT_0039190757 /DNA_START=112 /DNA_END=1381 /DNA_ORIENTATION=-
MTNRVNSYLSLSSNDETVSVSSSLYDDISTDEEEEVFVPVEPHVGYKKVLVTGGAGFIGSHVAAELLRRGDDVVIVDEMNDYYDVEMKKSNLILLQEKYGNERLSIYDGDICDEKLMLEVFESEQPQWVCHMAARAGVRPSIADPFVYIHSNIRGTTQLMELSHKFGVQNFVFASSSSVYGGSKSDFFSENEAVDNPDIHSNIRGTTQLMELSHKFGVQNFVFASSSSVYGGSKSDFFSENEAVDNPVSPYAASKKACELLSYTYHHLYNLNVTALRFFTVYGPRGRPDMAPFKFIDRISRGLEIQQFGDGTSSRDYTYIDDIVDGVVRSIDRKHGYEVFNLGKGNGTSLKEFINLVEKHTGKDALIKIMPDQPGDVPFTCADVRKAKKYIGYSAKIPFEEGIRRTAKWYQGVYDKSIPEM